MKPRSASGKSASVSVASPHVLSKYLAHFDRSSFVRLANVGSSDILARRTPRNPHGGIFGHNNDVLEVASSATCGGAVHSG